MKSKAKIFAFNNAIKYGIVIVNTIIRMVVIAIITMVGCQTESGEMSYVTDCVFICQFFNTGFLLMLCGANLYGQGLPFGVFFQGSISDFDSMWFDNMGATIIGSMRFNIFFPIANEILWYGIRSALRLKDGAFTEEDKSTKKTSIQQYVNLMSGPKYFMHFKYSGLMNVTFITMMFGAGIPQLFQIAAATYIVLYTLENFMLYYVYKAPPAYDEKLNNSVLTNLSYSPLLLLSFGYWMLSNKQLMQRYESLTPIEHKTDAFLA